MQIDHGTLQNVLGEDPQPVAPPTQPSARCRECNGVLPSSESPFCPHCGASARFRPPVNPAAQGPSQVYVVNPKSRSIAVLLAFFLGGFGIHKFYLNRPGWGILYALTFWTLIPAIVAFVEAIIYLFMSEQSFQETYTPKAYYARS